MKQSLADDAGLDGAVVGVQLTLHLVAIFGRGAMQMLIAAVTGQRFLSAIQKWYANAPIWRTACLKACSICYVATEEMWRVRERPFSIGCFVEHRTAHMIVWMIGAHHHEERPINA